MFGNGVFNLRGGSVNSIRALAGSEINIFGSQFSIGGTPVTVAPGQTLTVQQRNVTLQATLADGTVFEIFMRPTDPGFPSNPVVLSTATLNLVGAETVTPGDVNEDGEVNLLDVAPFIDLLASSEFSESADINMDGSVNLLDVGPFIDLLSQ